MKLLRLTILFLFVTAVMNLSGQNSSPVKKSAKKYPASFSISKSEIEKLFSYKAGETVVTKSNKYLNKSNVVMNTQNGDTRFLRIRLNYFAKSYLTVQINGTQSTQVFVLSDDKSVSYKGKPDRENYVMNKCDEEEIISE